MADAERRDLVRSLKRSLLNLSAEELFQIAKSLVPTPGVDQPALTSEDEDSCFQYISSVMNSNALVESEDMGVSQLLMLRDSIDDLIQGQGSPVKILDHGLDAPSPDIQINDSHIENSNATDNLPENEKNYDTDADTHNVMTLRDTEIQQLLTSYEELSKKITQFMPVATRQSVVQSPTKTLPRPQVKNDSRNNTAEHTNDKVVSLRDLSYLHRREFKIQGGQIGDQGSDISYNNICRQIDEGFNEQFSSAEIVRAVLRVIKPGNFKDMLMNKDELTVEELKDFLHSHLGEQNNTELFKELMCTKQNDSETPQQFLYRVIGLKQKILLASKHVATDVKYSASTVQDVFLHTVYQGLGHKHSDVRRELKPLLADPSVTDETILKHLKKVMSDESERQRRLGPVTRPRPTSVHSAVAEPNAAQSLATKEDTEKKRTNKKTDMIQQLADKVEKLTNMVEHMQQSLQAQKAEQANRYVTGKVSHQREKRYACVKCLEENRPNCPHCFYCGEEGHRAVGCLKKSSRQGNWSRSLSRDKQ